MKFLTILILFLGSLNFLSCKDSSSSKYEKSSGLDPADSNFVSTKQLTTHIIDVKCGGGFIPLRSRILSEKELELSQKGNTESQQLNDEVIINRLYNGEWIKILKADTLGYHYVQVVDRVNSTEQDDQHNVRGYIVSKYCNKPTVRKFERVHISKFDNANDDVKGLIEFLEYHVPNGNLLDYAFTFVSDEADLIQTLSFNVSGENTIHYKLYQVVLQHDRIMCEGAAELYTRYRKGESEFSKYITENITGTNFEIHINESDNTAFLKWFDENYMFHKDDDQIMQRIK